MDTGLVLSSYRTSVLSSSPTHPNSKSRSLHPSSRKLSIPSNSTISSMAVQACSSHPRGDLSPCSSSSFSTVYASENYASPITSPNPPHEPTIHGTFHFQFILGDGPHSYSIHSRGSKYKYGFIPFKLTHKSIIRYSESRLSNCTNSGSNEDTCSLSELISSSDQEDPTVDPLLNDHDVVPIDGTLH